MIIAQGLAALEADVGVVATLSDDGATFTAGRLQLIEHRLQRGWGLDPAWLTAQVQSMRQNTAHMLAIIGEMTDLARLHMGEALDLELAEVDVAGLVRAVAEEQTAAGPGRAPVTVAAPEVAVRVRGAVHQLRRVLGSVLGNVLGNALTYSPAGTPVT